MELEMETEMDLRKACPGYGAERRATWALGERAVTGFTQVVFTENLHGFITTPS